MARLILALAIAVAGYAAYTHKDWIRYERLGRGGQMTQGWVTGKSEGKGKGKREVYYAFRTPRKVFTDTGSGGFGNPEFDQLEEGEEVLVYYLPEDPDVSCM